VGAFSGVENSKIWGSSPEMPKTGSPLAKGELGGGGAHIFVYIGKYRGHVGINNIAHATALHGPLPFWHRVLSYVLCVCVCVCVCGHMPCSQKPSEAPLDADG
jgi:hypothetical protein